MVGGTQRTSKASESYQKLERCQLWMPTCQPYFTLWCTRTSAMAAHTSDSVCYNVCVWVCAHMCVWGSRIKIPLHLEAQTPWAGALKAAIRHAAVWGKVTVYLHCHPTSLTQTLGRSLLHPPLHHVLHLLSERWVDRAQQERPVRTIFWCARSADPFNKYPGSLIPVYSFFFICTFISNTSTMEHVKVAFTTEREDGMYDKKQ